MIDSLLDPVELAIFQNAMHSIAEEMGAALRRTAISPNIRERQDYSCAVFDAQERVIAMGDHMPVHLGSMPMSVEAAVAAIEFEPGDIAILNDPYAGGTHLPDITMVLPVFLPRIYADSADVRPAYYIANRAHHADVGGMFPGSMGPAKEIFQEGLRIPPVRIVRRGKTDREMLNLILLNVRTAQEREGDLNAQIGSCRVGERRIRELSQKHGESKMGFLVERLLDYSERLVRAELRKIPAGEHSAEDWLDEDGVSEEPIRIAVRLTFVPMTGSLVADFGGSSRQVRGSVNAVRAITLSACFYVLRCLLGEGAPSTAGVLRPLELKTEPGSIVDAISPAPVAGGNVETSQRIVDVLLKALAKAMPVRVPAASAGTMSNLTIGGVDTRDGGGKPFTYYETTAGGMGARDGLDGISGVQTHMTNSLNTPIEALEYSYPLRVLRYGYRAGSGGAGQFKGGDGLIREIELLADAQVTLLADRRKFRPYGLHGGLEGEAGVAFVIENGEQVEFPGKCSRSLKNGVVLRVETPGGGGWGKSKIRDEG